uniref:Sulfotransfer_1 domain-containing protein n=1 Tax=Panagrellus redivivus TaxID=6233 RepID=A0A7E4VBP2_PANRE
MTAAPVPSSPPWAAILLFAFATVCYYDVSTVRKSETFFDEAMLDNALAEPLPATEGISTNDTSNGIAKFCSVDNSLCLPQFLDLNEPFVRKVVVVPQYKMLSCILPKCMSTTTTRIFSYLYDKEKYLDYKWKGQKKSATHHENDFDSMPTFKHNTHTTDEDLRAHWQMLVSVRNPLDRFASAFNNKCVNERLKLTLDPVLYGGGELCYGCQQDAACFLRKQFIRAKMYARGGLGRVGYEDQHTFPQSWFCNFGEYLNDFRIYRQASKSRERFRDVVMELLNKVNVTESEKTFVNQHIVDEDPSADEPPPIDKTDEVKSQILNDPKLLKIFIAMYYYDYILFDFEFPPEATALFEKELLSAK